MTIQYVATTRIIKVEERFDTLWVSGKGADTIFNEKSKGWFLMTSAGTFCFGTKCPVDLKPGSTIEITFQRIEPTA
jgi:hypothetical protein